MARAPVLLLLVVAGAACEVRPRPVAPPPRDLALPVERAPDLQPKAQPDLAPPGVAIAWHLMSCKNAPGCSENGYARSCAEARVKSLRLGIRDERSGAETVTRVPCPAASTDGEVVIRRPRGEGPFTLRITSADRPSARSEVICHVTPPCWARGFSVNVYAGGCNDPECVACVEGNHVPGWCE